MTIRYTIAGLVLPVLMLGLLARATPAQAAGNDDELLKQMDSAKLTLTKAVEAAETASKGKAVAAHAKMVDKTGQVLVFCVVSGKCMEVPVDIKTGAAGKVTEATAKGEKAEHITKAADILKKLEADKHTLAKLIEAAETDAKGKAIAIRPALQGDKLDMNVQVNANSKWETLTVDAKTGKVVKTEEAKGEKAKEEKKPDQKKGGDKKP